MTAAQSLVSPDGFTNAGDTLSETNRMRQLAIIERDPEFDGPELGLLELASDFAKLADKHLAQPTFTKDELLCVLAALGDQQKIAKHDAAYSRDNMAALDKTHTLLGQCK